MSVAPQSPRAARLKSRGSRLVGVTSGVFDRPSSLGQELQDARGLEVARSRAEDGLVHPFASNRVRQRPFRRVKGTGRGAAFDASRGFTEHERTLIRSTAYGIEWIGVWSEEGAQRLRFVLAFWYATGLRPSEMVDAHPGAIEHDIQGDAWLNVRQGQQTRKGCVATPGPGRARSVSCAAPPAGDAYSLGPENAWCLDWASGSADSSSLQRSSAATGSTNSPAVPARTSTPGAHFGTIAAAESRLRDVAGGDGDHSLRLRA